MCGVGRLSDKPSVYHQRVTACTYIEKENVSGDDVEFTQIRMLGKIRDSSVLL